MAKSLTIKNKNNQILYPKTVSSLVYDNSTGNTVKQDLDNLIGQVAELLGVENAFFGGIVGASTDIATDYTNNGYSGPYLYMVGTDMSSLVAYQYTGSGSPTQLFSGTTYDFTDYSDVSVESDGNGDLDLSDEQGYVLGRFENGHIRTKNFYSGDACTEVQVDDSVVSDLDIADVDGYTLGRFENGHIRTKNFYSGNVYTKDEVDSLISGGSGGGPSGGVTLQLLEQGLATKLNTLISGTNIKTINKVSLLGSGNIITSPQYIKWNGKKIGALGDSITAGYNTTKTYLLYLQDELDCTIYNYGLNSSPVHEKATSSTDSFVDRASSVRNDLDLLLILGGVNDFLWAASDFLIGDVYTINNRQLVMNTDVTSFCGAYNTMLLTLVTKLPNKQIYLMTPLHHANFGSQNVSSWRTNAAGQKLQDYVDAIKNIGQFWGLPVIDLYGESGMNPNIEASRVAFYNHYVPDSTNNDSLHPDANGHKRIAETILKHI